MKALITILLLTIATAAPTFAGAAEPRELTWQELAPDVEPMDNPFLELSIDQTLTFREYLDHLDLPELEHTPEQQQRQKDLRATLESDGFDPDDMVKQYRALVAHYRQAERATRAEVLDQLVKLPGYLLPLNVKDGAVTEFLLVPTIGACIHEPVPPANQMVFVRFESGFKEAGLFQPVWIRGKLKAEARSQDLFLMDGSSDVQVAYAMEAESVWLY